MGSLNKPSSASAARGPPILPTPHAAWARTDQNSSSNASVLLAARLSANILRKICHHDHSDSKRSNTITACTTTLAWATMATNDRSG